MTKKPEPGGIQIMKKTTRINDFDSEAEYYDLFENKNQPLFDLINNFLKKLFLKNKIKTVLDVTCGTGAQAIPLSKKGFHVLGSDIGKSLLKIAAAKSKNLPNIKFVHGDARRSKHGKFDAVISILNSLGYLTKNDFKKALANINHNLSDNGLLIFDNTNRSCLDCGNFITDKIIDTAGERANIKFIRFSKSKYSKKTGIILTRWETLIQCGHRKPMKNDGLWKRQTYSLNDLKNIFNETGFKLENIYDRSLADFDEKRSFSYMVVARKTEHCKTSQ